MVHIHDPSANSPTGGLINQDVDGGVGIKLKGQPMFEKFSLFKRRPTTTDNKTIPNNYDRQCVPLDLHMDECYSLHATCSLCGADMIVYPILRRCPRCRAMVKQ